jgi:hypothetical protein
VKNAHSADVGTIEKVLSAALELREASLVMFRRGILAEFKTELLRPGLSASQEGGFRSWQIGPYEGHHCHLDLAMVSEIWFDAEPVSCQGGRLNYTAWFLGSDDCGNPYRANGLFSVTLNAPYAKDGRARTEDMFSVYSRHAHLQGVSCSEGFGAAQSAFTPVVRTMTRTSFGD